MSKDKPIEIYGSLAYVGLDANGEMHLFVKKEKSSLYKAKELFSD